MKPSKNLLIISILAILGFVAIAGSGIGDGVKGVTDMRFGIDIRGGVEAVFEPENLDRKATGSELEIARNVIETRLDSKNITDREVTVDKDGGYIIVRFPWKSNETNFNPEDAISELGDMAKLTFRDPQGNVLLEGKNIKHSSPAQDQSTTKRSYVVKLTFDSKGAELFEKATGDLIGKNLGIYMDDQQISNPTVEAKISGGEAVINNLESYKKAKDLSEKINAGALPFSLKTSNFSTISPTLGNNALKIMVIAGIIAFLLVCIFMIWIYKLPGIIACAVLVLQMALQLLAISVPQYTITLPGIAGIILSLGMAVDANIIISERITDEIGKGKSIKSAIVSGYKRAFSSVLDGNVTTAIVAVILMKFGSGSMLSFGYTLLVGMIVNVLVGVVISKKMLQSVLEYPKFNDTKYFKKYKERKRKKFYESKKIFIAISSAVFIAGIIGCFTKGVSLDTQFTGGVVLTYNAKGDFSTDEIKKAVSKDTDRPVTVQITKNRTTKAKNIVVTLAGRGGMSPQEQKKITQDIASATKNDDIKLSETYAVEPYIGEKALKNAAIAIILSIIFIIIYVWIRFSGLSAGVTATLALVHDVFVVFFTFVLFGIPLNDAFVAVVLTIIGYSINDTIVLYDRIREHQHNNSKQDIIELVNDSTTETFTRSINTSITTGLCVFVILAVSVYANIDSIVQFSLPMFFGIISGCYSSICVAGIIWAGWQKHKIKPNVKTGTKPKSKIKDKVNTKAEETVEA